MLDKYSKLEGKIEEGIRRTKVMLRCFEFLLGQGEFLSWEVVGVRDNKEGVRVNIVEIKVKKSSVRFLLNQKVLDMQKYFEEGFLDNQGKREKIVFRVR